MDVAWVLFWQIISARNLIFFPCKVAPAGNERYLGCAAVAAGIVLTCDWLRTVGVASRCSVRVCVCVVIGCFGILGCRSHWENEENFL